MVEEIKKRILADLKALPGQYRRDAVIKELIRCVLYAYLKEIGLVPVPEFRYPGFPEGPVDLAGLDETSSVKLAFSSGPTVELNQVKSMERIEAERKIIITFSTQEKKVRESMFFLKKGIDHLYLFE
jgi:hypothetical protein